MAVASRASFSGCTVSPPTPRVTSTRPRPTKANAYRNLSTRAWARLPRASKASCGRARNERDETRSAAIDASNAVRRMTTSLNVFPTAYAVGINAGQWRSGRERILNGGQHLDHNLAACLNGQCCPMIFERAESSELRRKQHL